MCGKSETCNPLLPTDRKKRADYAKSFPTHRKLGKNSVDKTPGLWLNGGGLGLERNGAAPQGRPEDIDECPEQCGKRTTNHPIRGGPIVEGEGKSRAGSERGKKDVNK